MKKTLSTMAAAILLASTAIAPAVAQTQPATPAPTTPAPSDSGSMPGNGAASGGYLTEQGENQISASDFIGKSVYNAEDKSIGDINDLVMEENGGIVAAVIGVGGFLGIGEKDVALPMDRITMTRDADNNNEVRLTTTETAEALQAAPEFQTLADKQAETDRTTTSSTNGNATTPSTTTPNQ